jgi:two-component system nitrogen regulation sensor histidine kinase GlnL
MKSIPQPGAALVKRILENLHTSVVLFDGDLRLRYINPSAEMLFSLSARRVVGADASSVFASGELLDNLRSALDTGHPFTERELVLNLPNGHRSTVDFTAIPLQDPSSGKELLVEMTELDRQLRITREENLLSQTGVTRALVRGLAHEIKNPLGGLRGAAQLLERELESDDQKEYTRIIISEADRLQNLMNRMLGPNTMPQKQPMNVHEVLEHVRHLMRPALPPGVVLKTDYDPSIPELMADRDQLVQAVLNLLSNAVQSVGEAGCILVRTRTLRQYTIGKTRHKLVARIDIIDDGPGVPPELLENIFLPMVTGRAAGTGLGLPIAQSMVSMHGGLIECESQPGRTVFTILLPLTEIPEPAGEGNH